MLKRLAVAAAAVLSISLSMEAAFAQPPDGKGATIRYQVYQSTAEILMRVAGQMFCARYNLVCKPIFLPSSAQGLQALAGDSVDVIYIGTDFGIRAIANGANIKAISGASDRLNLQLVDRKDVSFPNLRSGYPKLMQDYEGKHVGITGRGSTGEIAFSLMMQDAGYSSDKVTFVPVGGPATALGALKSKQVDAVMLFQPLPAICDTTENLCETAVDLTSDRRPPVIAQFDGAAISLFSSDNLIQNSPDALKAYIAAVNDAAVWLKDPANYKKAVVLTKGYLDLAGIPNSEQVLEIGLKEQIRNTKTTISISGVDRFIKSLSERKMLGNPVKTSDVIWSSAATSGQ